MKNVFGNSVTVTLAGESHGEAIGAVLDGMAPGIPVDPAFIRHRMQLRMGIPALSTARREPDEVEIVITKEGALLRHPKYRLVKTEKDGEP